MRSLLALFGGTFDPVHLGHLGAIEAVLQRSGCDALHVIPAHSPPLRDAPQADAGQRLAMLGLACADLPQVVLDDRELRRSGPSFTVDTLLDLRAELGAEAALGWVIGSDALAQLHRWHRWEALLELTHLLVLERPAAPLAASGPVADALAGRWVDDPAALRQASAGSAWRVGQPPLAISASQVRGLMSSGQSAAHLLPAPVWRYITERGLYGMGPDLARR